MTLIWIYKCLNHLYIKNHPLKCDGNGRKNALVVCSEKGAK